MGYVTALSVVALAAERSRLTTLYSRLFGSDVSSSSSYIHQGGYVEQHGGLTILAFQGTRFTANLALTALASADYFLDRHVGKLTVILAAVRSLI